ncbi:MAG: type II methionyl aminopeptidase [Candidatus Bilamarchaeaceae archaeon]
MEYAFDVVDDVDDFRTVGRLAAKIREESKRLIMVDEPLLDIAETIEQMIVAEGAKPAFPVNISVNDIAAHFTPTINDTRTIDENMVVKVDIGVALNGAIGDTAYTIDLSGKSGQLIKATEDALENAIKEMKPDKKVGEIGGVIEETAKKHGYKTISNLSGHKIKTGILHAGVDVPNLRTDDDYVLKEGDIFAVEPFLTTGAGYVIDTDEVNIFSFYDVGAVKMRQSKKIFEYILTEYGVLPFAERWVIRAFSSKLLVNAALKEMLEGKILKGYPVLKEAGGGIVAQAEHTVLITSDGNEVLTR